jgi:hypothetical protein
MWVIARFVFLGLVFLFRAFWRRQGVDQSVLYRGTRRVSFEKKDKIYWGLEWKTPLIFELTAESGWDRVNKFFGVATELKTGDATFDRKVYVASDHPELHRLLTEDAALRRGIVALFNRGAKRIYSDGRHLWVEPTELAHASDQDLAELHGIWVVLQGTDLAHSHRLLDPFLGKAIAVEALIWSVALYFAPGQVEQLYRSYVLGAEQRCLDLSALERSGLIFAAGAFVGLMGLIILFLRGSSRGHRLMLESVAVLGFSLSLSGSQVISDYSHAHYIAAPRMDFYRVTARWKEGGEGRDRSAPRYYLTLEALSDGAPHVRPSLRVSGKNYYDVQKGGVVKIISQLGRLNIPWLVRLETSPDGPLPARGSR